jgi:membrane protease YdiL (CAAX protease family)
MSILPDYPLAATADGAPIDVVLIVLTAGSLGAAFFSGLLPPRNLPGPSRLPVDRSAWPLVGVLFGAMGFYMFAASAIMSLWQALAPRYGATIQPLESDAGIALLSTLPPVLGLIGLWAGDHLVGDGVGQNLGFEPARIRRGILFGLAGAALVLPPLYLLSQIMELVYRHVHYEHPTEHPLLRVLGEGPSPAVKAAIIFGACIVAPFWEELVFRAHVQTLLLRAIQWLADVGRVTGEALPVAPVVPDTPVVPGTPDLHDAPPMREPKPWMSWGAIVITSTLFAAIHPLWSAPIIFVLALFLAYAYERTGNLWVSITMHAMFNIVSTILFLAGTGSH